MVQDEFDLGAFLPYRLNRVAELISLRFAAQYKARFQMTRPEWRTLAALGSTGRMTATEVGQHSSMHKTKVSRAVRSLEQRRWLKRTEDAEDRRVEHLELTSAGTKAYDEMVVLARSYEAALAEEFGRQTVSSLLSGLAAAERVLAAKETR